MPISDVNKINGFVDAMVEFLKSEYEALLEESAFFKEDWETSANV
jgi:hypothetical protein